MSPAWKAIATFIIRQRILLLVILGLLISLMWSLRGTEVSHELTQVIPIEDEELSSYLDFKEQFGEDGNVLVVGIEGDFFTLPIFNGIYDLVEDLKEVDGVENVVAITHLYNIKADNENERYEVFPVVQEKPTTQEEVDSLANEISSLPFYKGLLLDDDAQTTLIAISIVDTFLNSKRKTEVYDGITAQTNPFEEKFDIPLRYAGLPAIRVNVHKTIKWELALFLYIALGVLAITLLIFFRSFYMVIFPMLVVLGVIICTLGLIGIFDFKITLVLGVIPALITVITIPNCVYLITKYHIEYRRTKNKMKSLIQVIEKIGIVTIMTNTTTAVGLGVLAFTDIQPLKEFGIIAGLSVVAAFFISLILIPIVLSFLPPPTDFQTKHLDRKTLDFSIKSIDKIVHFHKWKVITASVVIAIISLYGMSRILPIAYIVDDIPEDSKILTDLRYIEENFNGALPFEILIDTKKPRGVQRLSTLKKVYQLQKRLAEGEYYQDKISRSFSATDFVMFLRQSLFGGDPEAYDIPSRDEYNFIRSFLQNTELNTDAVVKSTLTDSLMQKTRVSSSIRDIGSLEMEALIDSVTNDIEDIFGTDTSRYKISITGTTPIFIKGNEYLINNLLTSLAIAFVIIAMIMGLLFRSWRMIVISLIPNFLPLIMVAGVMGFFGIPLKPSTALVFGVAFGIAVDDSIHFLARYRLARSLGDTISQAITNSFQDTGVSMIYTSIILFFGFVTFTASSFGGTQALGTLTSITLGIAMFSNLLLLPVLLLLLDKDNEEG
ncbi:MAG: MMPL family transporter, partial [Bacteroidota bacterium]